MKIMLDAGHGPNTIGKRTPDGKMKEFEFNEAVAQLVKNELTGFDLIVMNCHDRERDVPLKERTTLANKMRVDAFISLHANAYGTTWNNTSGIETFTYTKPSEQSVILATLIQNSLCSITGRWNRGVKKADFSVVRDTRMPAVLVECGFMTNKHEAILLQSTEYRMRCAKAISFAILCWIQQKR
ncbi:N-acetylmuramoyl-L-alanine amidase [Psychrobacillus sp. INOP01]|uniref:N-acetylmuramoyl-L-alanine amidase n=1 Tax=Psychrobacillus sp. INOP01 TaxID=2829187 RepID=UPI001BAAD441|nr:N-acetylmuramoyl-L-alanine amidase [Psychrobacillus sp. INOP01]QUG42677.1 N-acetylmuramoyl-L-alanine amidase [Psychrobacillus sp. INOP01]